MEFLESVELYIKECYNSIVLYIILNLFDVIELKKITDRSTE